jgi:hypothetical protein
VAPVLVGAQPATMAATANASGKRQNPIAAWRTEKSRPPEALSSRGPAPAAEHGRRLQAVAGGALSIDEGNALSAVFERAGKSLYESDLERRLVAIERAQNARIIEGRMV